MYHYDLFNWDPQKLLRTEENFSVDKYSVIILNTAIKWKPEFLLPLWEKASMRVTVDGGSNCWFNWLRENHISSDAVKLPHLTTGDMDSIDDKILEFLKEKKVTIARTHDQNETDYTKALREIKSYIELKRKKIMNIIAIVDSSGRLDQTMANVQTLFLAREIIPQCNIFNLANDSLSWILFSGKHKIQIPESLRTSKEWCGLIPIGSKAEHINTTGLKWNLVDRTLSFGDLVSTSNTYSDKLFVTVETNNPLLWCMGLKGIL